MSTARYHVTVGGLSLCQSSISASVRRILEEQHLHVACGQDSIESATRLADALRNFGYDASAEASRCPTVRRHK
jgi:hypothetical protein